MLLSRIITATPPVGLGDGGCRLIVPQDSASQRVARKRCTADRNDDHFDRLAGLEGEMFEQQFAVFRKDSFNAVRR